MRLNTTLEYVQFDKVLETDPFRTHTTSHAHTTRSRARPILTHLCPRLYVAATAYPLPPHTHAPRPPHANRSTGQRNTTQSSNVRAPCVPACV
jgi:hypothetical protein